MQARWTWWDSSGGFWDTRLRVNKEGINRVRIDHYYHHRHHHHRKGLIFLQKVNSPVMSRRNRLKEKKVTFRLKYVSPIVVPCIV